MTSHTYTALCTALRAEREESGVRVVETPGEPCACGAPTVYLRALDVPLDTDRRAWLCCPACDRAERMS